jgi:Protein of unknown function (DUF1588)/Protein of unknown function (DUF1592)/Protein of unknown function (DUF1595)/Protein of unknown function (DUF1587)
MSPALDRKVLAPLFRLPLAGLALLVASGCTAMVSPGGSGPPNGNSSGGSGSGTAGAGVSTGGASAIAGAGASAAGGVAGATGPLSTGGVKLRLLTQAEYLASIQDLLGTLKAPLTLPADLSVAGFISVGAANIAVGDLAVEQYETATLAATAEVFGDTQRWQTLVGCQPKADLSDACVTTFIKSFGRRAFRRDLVDAEVTQWVGVAQSGAQVASSAAQGLAAATSGLLQSPNFLYRVETNKLDASNGRLKYDGLSMANRLSYLLTGGPPSDALLTSAAAGQLDTADGVRAAATQFLTNANAVDRMAGFFSEFGAVQQVLKVTKDATLFPQYNSALQSSMYQGTQLFIKNIVLAPTADVRSFFDSPQTFADAALAPIYGVPVPASGFAQVMLPAANGRAGILGQASVIAGQSQENRNSPTRRGVFILSNLLCSTPPPPPAGVNTAVVLDPTITARQQMIAHRATPSCNACHGLFDPMGFALEHFDPIGQYRATEHGLTIDATGTVDSINFDGGAALGAALRQDPRAMSCMMSGFYRDANASVEATAADAAQIDSLVKTLATDTYVWRNLVADFVVSDAFRSAPALPVMTASP